MSPWYVWHDCLKSNLNNCWICRDWWWLLQFSWPRWLTDMKIFNITATKDYVLKDFVSRRNWMICWAIFGTKRSHWNKTNLMKTRNYVWITEQCLNSMLKVFKDRSAVLTILFLTEHFYSRPKYFVIVLKCLLSILVCTFSEFLKCKIQGVHLIYMRVSE